MHEKSKCKAISEGITIAGKKSEKEKEIKLSKWQKNRNRANGQNEILW